MSPTPTETTPTSTTTLTTTETTSCASKLLDTAVVGFAGVGVEVATPCTLTLLPRTRRKSACVLLPTGRAPLDNVLEVLAMSGIVGSHLAAELNVPAVALSRLRHDFIGSDGYVVIAEGEAQAIQSKLLWGLCDIAAATPPISETLLQGWRSWATWCYITGLAPEAHWSFTSDHVKALARTVSAYLDEQKPPLVLVRYLSGLSTADFAASLALSRQRMHLIEGRDPKGDELCSRYLALACRKHLQHLTADSFWGKRGLRIFPTETP